MDRELGEAVAEASTASPFRGKGVELGKDELPDSALRQFLHPAEAFCKSRDVSHSRVVLFRDV
ncbi:unnamed protein product [Symbiodinium microadriaticum]|nr:unnamed protein product [Symbiodinium microadriaticum]